MLVCALLNFTTLYRHSAGFSPATATRCHSLSTDATDAQTLFAGDFGPLAPVIAPALPVWVECWTWTTVAPRVAPERPVALVATPFRRPPPPGVA